MKLDAEVCSEGRYTTFGSALVRMIQNNYLPSLDLVVREATQNSMDAALPNATEVKVNYTYGLFDGNYFSSFFPVIGENLKNRYSNSSCKFLAVSDYNTTGLVGNLDGMLSGGGQQNLGKLVFHIMNAQNNFNAGGSWGIGKTVYFRLGVGLVIYYSRIKKDNGTYEERLVCTLAEDEEDPHALLHGMNNIGIAFFGTKKPGSENTIQATTDTNVIHELLEIFKIEPYKITQTGTTIIIPYLDDVKMKYNMANDENNNGSWWEENIEDYLEVSLLRWYFPRMSESYSLGARLKAFVNGRLIKPTHDTYVYEKFNELYKYAFTSSGMPEWINRKEITRTNNVVENSLGTFVYGEINRNEFGNNPIPQEFALIHKNNEDLNKPLVCITRRPGMIVNYQNEGSIVGNIKTEPDRFIIGIFVLNSKNTLKLGSNSINLDEYVRGSEESDHTSWCDYQVKNFDKKLLIVKNINNGISNILSDTYGEVKKLSGTENISHSLSNKFGKLLLPKEGFGNKVRPPREGNGGGSSGGSGLAKVCKWKLKRQQYTSEGLNLSYNFKVKAVIKSITIEIKINSISSGYTVEKWEKEGGKFPFELDAITLRSLIYNGGTDTTRSLVFTKDSVNSAFKEFNIKFLKSPETNVCYGIKFEQLEPNKKMEFDLNMRIKCLKDKHYQSQILVEVER